jgi:hypothetical protein
VRAAIAVAFALCSPLGGCGACEPDRPPPPREGSPDAPAETTAALADQGSPPAPAARTRPASLPCRAITVDGLVWTDAHPGSALALFRGFVYDEPDADAAATLARSAEIPQGPWLSLARDARVVAKDPRTGREATFRGPGLVRVCVDSAEEAWVWSGRFESTLGSGESPGAEQWIVMPLGVVRFGAARLTASVWAKGAAVNVGGGVAFLWTSPDAVGRDPGGHAIESASPAARPSGADAEGGPSPTVDGWTRLSGGVATLAPTVEHEGTAAYRATLEAAGSAVDTCARTGKAASDLARALLGGDANVETAERQVTARRVARAACGVAALRVDTLPASDARTALVSSLAEGAARWRSAPRLR